MGAAGAPPAGFNSTMQLPKRQLNKIVVLVEFVIHGGLRTPWVYRSSYFVDGQILSKPACVPVYTHAGFSYHIGTAQKAPLFPSPQQALGRFNRQHSKLHPGK